MNDTRELLQALLPAVARLRAAHRTTVIWLSSTFVALVAVRFGVAATLEGTDGGLSAGAVARLQLLDVGLMLTALGAAVFVAVSRFDRVLRGLARLLELVSTRVEMSATVEEREATTSAAMRALWWTGQAAEAGRVPRSAIERAFAALNPVPAQTSRVFCIVSTIERVRATAPVKLEVDIDVGVSGRGIGDADAAARALAWMVDALAAAQAPSQLFIRVNPGDSEASIGLEVGTSPAGVLVPGDYSGSHPAVDLNGLAEAAAVVADATGVPLKLLTSGRVRFVAELPYRAATSATLSDSSAISAADVTPPAGTAFDEATTGAWMKTGGRKPVSTARMGRPAVERRLPPLPVDDNAVTNPMDRFDDDISGWEEAAELLTSQDVIPVTVSPRAWAVEDTQTVVTVSDDQPMGSGLFEGPDTYAVSPSPRVERTTGTTPIVPDDGSEHRALLVDHDPMARWNVSGILMQLGFEVEAVRDGESALQAIGNTRFSLVVLDTHLPDINGFQTAIRIRAALGESGPPIVALTTVESDAERARCEAAGIDALLTKPVDEVAFRAILRPLVSSVSATTTVDRDLLEQLEGIQRASEQPELVQRMIATFIERAENAFRAFDLGFDEADSALVRVTAERLRRQCATLGAVRMEEMSQRVSAALREGGLKSARPLVDSLHDEFDRVRPVLTARLEVRA